MPQKTKRQAERRKRSTPVVMIRWGVIGVIIACFALLLNLWRVDARSRQTVKNEVRQQEKRDENQDVKVERNTKDIRLQYDVHREDMSVMRKEMHEEWRRAARRQDEIMGEIRGNQ